MLSALKNFGVTFLVAALIFGVLAYFGAMFVSRTVNDLLDEGDAELTNIINTDGEETAPAESKPATEDPTEDPLPSGKSVNCLFVVDDYRPDLYNDYTPDVETIEAATAEFDNAVPTLGMLSAKFRSIGASAIVLVRIDTNRKQVVYTYFTPEMRVYTPAGYRTLSEIYSIYGVGQLAEYVNAFTGLRIEYTYTIDGFRLDELTEVLGSVTVSLPRDIYDDGTKITMEFETLVEHIGTDGWPWMEHVPNQWLLGAGDRTVTGEDLFTLNSVEVHTEADRDAKQNYTLSLVREYLKLFASLGEEDAVDMLARPRNRPRPSRSRRPNRSKRICPSTPIPPPSPWNRSLTRTERLRSPRKKRKKRPRHSRSGSSLFTSPPPPF